jgi:hypothetical protein
MTPDIPIFLVKPLCTKQPHFLVQREARKSRESLQPSTRPVRAWL